MYKVFLILLFLVSISYCQSPDSVTLYSYYNKVFKNSITRNIENWEANQYSFPQGFYYKCISKVDTIIAGHESRLFLSTNYPEMIIGFLLGIGIPIKDVWYRAPDNNCNGFDVMVLGSMLIRTEKELSKDYLSKYGFEFSEKPAIGGCPNDILHYTFK